MNLEEFHKHLNQMDTDVQIIVEECWDWTGRPVTEHPITVALCLLLDTIVTPEQFRVKGRQITDGMKEMTDGDFDVIYFTYEQGMKRVKRVIEEDLV